MNSKELRRSFHVLIRLPKSNICLKKEVRNVGIIIQNRKENSVMYSEGSGIECLKNRDKEFCWFYNISFLTPIELSIRRIIYKQKCILSLHEPKMSNKRAYGWKKAIRIFLVELLVRLSMNQSNAVVVFSEIAKKKVLEMNPRETKLLLVQPLLQALTVEPKKYKRRKDRVILVGKFHSAKRLEMIKRVIQHASVKASNLIFRVYTSEIDKTSRLWLESMKNVELIYKNKISDSEIWDGFYLSKVLLKLDTNMTQSD